MEELRMTQDRDGFTPPTILRDILQNDPNRIGTYIIFGQIGPTGKTWLCQCLRNYGYHAVELSEFIYDLCMFNDERNHYRVNPVDKTVMIILNQPLH